MKKSNAINYHLHIEGYMNIFVAKVVVVAGLLCSFLAQGNDVIECYGCNSTAEHGVASAWAMNNISETEARAGTSKKVVVIDLLGRKISTFQAFRKAVQPPPPLPMQYLPHLVTVANDPALELQMKDLISAESRLKAAVAPMTIPKSVIAHPWEFINCAYCQNHIRDYLNNSIQGEVETVAQLVNHFATTFGLLKTSLPNTYRLPLQSGGQITFKLTLTNSPIELELEIISVSDENGNNIPLVASQLKGLNLQIMSLQHARIINFFINPYQMFVEVRTGRVTIKDCSGADAPRCS